MFVDKKTVCMCVDKKAAFVWTKRPYVCGQKGRICVQETGRMCVDKELYICG